MIIDVKNALNLPKKVHKRIWKEERRGDMIWYDWIRIKKSQWEKLGKNKLQFANRDWILTP